MIDTVKSALFLFLAVGALTGYFVYRDWRIETVHTPRKDDCLYSPLVSAFLGAVTVPAMIIITLLMVFIGNSEIWFLDFLVNLLWIGAYYCLLLALRPLLRKWFRAAALAVLWTLPGFTMFLLIRLRVNCCIWTLRLPFAYPGEYVVHIGICIWLLIAGLILIRSIVAHLIFRRKILKSASPVQDDAVLQAYERQCEIIKYRSKSTHLFVSPAVNTPLTIGVYSNSIVLPERAYSAEELALIFRHELVHICRMDSWVKLFLTACKALFWFNPFMWIAMKACAEDLEMSCDEAVLYGYDAEVRKQYAGLLLETAADQRGFTTCLSASPKAMRYRLKEAVAPRKRLIGAIFVGILAGLLILLCAFTDIAFRPEIISLFEGSELKDWRVSEMFVSDRNYSLDLENVDKQALLEYVSSLQLYRHTKELDVYGEENVIQVVLKSEKIIYRVTIGGNKVMVVSAPLVNGVSYAMETTYYTMDGDLDWAAVCSWIN